MKNSRGEHAVNSVVVVGFGSHAVYETVCAKCGKLEVFSEDTAPFCSECFGKKGTRAILDGLPSSIVPSKQIVGYEQRSESRKTRISKNFTKVLRRDEFTCQYCGYSPLKHSPPSVLSVDHIRPFSNGGGNVMENLVCSCVTCNSIASNKIFDSFIDKKIYIVEQRERRGLPLSARAWDRQQQSGPYK